MKKAVLLVLSVATIAIVQVQQHHHASPSQAQAATQAAYHYDTDLRWWVHNTLEYASIVGTYGKQIPLAVEVRCYNTGKAFDQAYFAAFGEDNHTSDGMYTLCFWLPYSNTVYLRPLICSQAHRFISGTMTETTVNAFETLLHEALHRQGYSDEHLTEQYALGAMWAAGYMVSYNIQPTGEEDNAISSRAGWKAFNLAVEANNDYETGEYYVTRSQAVAAGKAGWNCCI